MSLSFYVRITRILRQWLEGLLVRGDHLCVSIETVFRHNVGFQGMPVLHRTFAEPGLKRVGTHFMLKNILKEKGY